ncbi:MAG: polysaccharide deacetylase family protein [Acidithiobacillus sp.]|uniref:polysaccharide deacetylase family protein n=1 Tax=Acidithiobacillus sp. TaxID=1872118 RepID=UPI0025BAB829|nr:polysaccharide deacetylase family protein [Acidithiobacillus sp.]
MSAIPILMYHNIDRAPRGVRLRGLYVSPGRFRRQMQLLKWLGFRGISQAEALPYLCGEAQGKVAVITFDDGYRDNLVHALPVLRDLGFRATCHVVSDAVGAYNRWDAEQLGARKAMMDAAELRQWVAAGMEVGAHSRSHARLPELDAAALREEIQGSRTALEDLLGQPVRSFCYPYGAAGERERALVRELGFASAVTVRRARARPGDDLWGLPRVAVGGHHGPQVFPLQILTAHEDRHR